MAAKIIRLVRIKKEKNIVSKKGSDVRILKKALLAALFSSFWLLYVHPISKGSDTVVSIEPFFNFPTGDSTNRMLTFGYFKNGFGLADKKTTCTFGSLFPVSGNINLRGGQLYLSSDLKLDNITTLVSPGTIMGNKHYFDLAGTITGIQSSYPCVLHNTRFCLNSDITLSGTLRIKGDCILDGKWNRLVLDPTSHILIDHGASLYIRNLELAGIKNGRLRCADATGRIILDNMRWVQSSDFTFTLGSFYFFNDVSFVGPYKFAYESKNTSTIGTDSCWFLSELSTLAIGRQGSPRGREPLCFTDQTASLRLENSTMHINNNGMRMTKGTFLIDGVVKLDMDSSDTWRGLAFGNGVAADDLFVKLFPASVLYLAKGHFISDIVARQNFVGEDTGRRLIQQGPDAQMTTNYDTYFSNVTVQMDPLGYSVLAPGKRMFFTNTALAINPTEFTLTATRTSDDLYVLADGGRVEITKGYYLLTTFVQGSGNLISGPSDIMSYYLGFRDELSDLTLAIDGELLINPMLNGGTLILGKDLRLGRGVPLTGPGKVMMNNYNFSFGDREMTWTDTIMWDGNGSQLNLQADLNLASPLTFNGDCTINGNGYGLNLVAGGALVVSKNSILKLKNIYVQNLSDSKLRCVDDSGSIICDDAYFLQSGSTTFTRGSINFINNVDIEGSYTFFYQSSLTSTIQSYATLRVGKDTTLSLGHKTGFNGREPIFMSDYTACLSIDDGTLNITSSGMRVLGGTLSIKGNMLFDLDSTCSQGGIIFGDGIEAHNPVCRLAPGAVVRLVKGHMVYEGTTPYFFGSQSKYSRVFVGGQFSFFVNKSVTFESVSVESSALWSLYVAPEQFLHFADCTVISSGVQYVITGGEYNEYTNLLYGNCRLFVSFGSVLMATAVAGTNNVLAGLGNIAGPVFLTGPSAQLLVSSDGTFLSPIMLNGGTVILDKGIELGENITFAGPGMVQMADKYVRMGGSNLVWTSTIYWDGDNALIDAKSSVYLSSKWTVSGSCMLNGNNNKIVFSPTAQICVEKGSTLHLKDVELEDITATQIYCLGQDSKIVFDNVTWSQDGNFSFNQGSFEVASSLIMRGDNSIFSYKSAQRSFINPYAQLGLYQNFSFFYDVPVPVCDLVGFRDNTGKMILDGATLVSTSTAWHLTKGTLQVKDTCYLSNSATCTNEGIMFGDGIVSSNDLKIDIAPESNLFLTAGYMNYQNVS